MSTSRFTAKDLDSEDTFKGFTKESSLVVGHTSAQGSPRGEASIGGVPTTCVASSLSVGSTIDFVGEALRLIVKSFLPTPPTDGGITIATARSKEFGQHAPGEGEDLLTSRIVSPPVTGELPIPPTGGSNGELWAMLRALG